MNDSDLLRTRLAEERIECSTDELAVLLAGLPAARATATNIWAVDCGDLPPISGLVEG